MATPEPAPDQLEQIWSAMIIKTFDEFIKYHVGFADSKPECFGTGDGHVYCGACPWQRTC
ncbi:hypothetical protein JXO52_01775 [bacterium]|nr:hypothetical protein [bacterium]